MRWAKWILGLVLGAVVAVGGTAPAADAPAELTRLRAVLVIDSNSSLKESVVNDGADFRRILKEAIPKDRLSVTILQGDRVTRKNILDCLQTLKTGSDETLLFYYAGHGAIDPQKGRYFVLQNVRKRKMEPIFRTEVRKILTQKKAGLTVLLSDCCSERLRVSDLRKRDIAPIHSPAVRCLFFQHRGVVDITAAEDNTSAWGDEHGGVFTRAFLRSLNPQRFKKLDGNRDSFLTWKEFFPVLRAQTETSFQSFARQARAQGKIVDQSAQKPRAINLAEPLAGVRPNSGTQEQAATALVQIVNGYGKPLKYRYRVVGGEWKQGSLADGAKTQLVLPLKEARPTKVELEAEAEDEHVSATLEATVVKGTPASSDSGRVYRIRKKN